MFCLLLASCQSSPGVVHDPYTGNTVVYSKRYEIRGGLFSNASARAIYSQRKGYGVSTDFMATGGSWMFFQNAWSAGKQYPYQMVDQKVLGCGSGCTLLETGFVSLDKHDFEEAAQRGFDFKLIGRGGAVAGNLPAEAFQQVLTQIR